MVAPTRLCATGRGIDYPPVDRILDSGHLPTEVTINRRVTIFPDRAIKIDNRWQMDVGVWRMLLSPLAAPRSNDQLTTVQHRDVERALSCHRREACPETPRRRG
jgi:hypothetical protein